MNKKYLQSVVLKLTQMGERQFERETKARKFIEQELRKIGLKYKIQQFTTFIPAVKKATLKLNGQSIPVQSTSFVSGKISSNYTILSSLISSQKFLYEANINFNPKSEAISRSNHYFAPSLAINRKDVLNLSKASKVEGEVVVQRRKHISANILVGNTLNPKNILFCHYDSISTGAVDNASGVALTLGILDFDQKVLRENLFVIAGNEEISYDQPIYWGHGYRVFEKEYFSLMLKAKNIFVLDCIGLGTTVILKNSPIIILGFPIDSIKRMSNKIRMLTGDFDKLMSIYHTSLDKPGKIDFEELVRAGRKLLKIIN